MSSSIAVTGGTGLLGGAVCRLLDHHGVEHVAVARDPDRLPPLPHALARGPAAYDESEPMTRALDGVDTLLLVSASLSGRRLAEHRAALDAAAVAGVERVVYVSLLGAAPDATYVNSRDHWQTERALSRSPLRWSVLRPSYYASTLARLTEDGVLRGPADDGRVSLVAHEDIAEVAVEVLLDGSGTYDREVLTVSGPEAITLAEAASRYERATGEPCRYEHEADRDARRRRSEADEPPDRAEGWVSWFHSVAAGEVAEVSAVVPDITGHPARSLEDALGR